MAGSERYAMKYLQVPFFKRFTIIGGIVFAMVITIAHLYYAGHTSRILHQRLQEKAVFINTFLAYSFSSALLLKDDISLLQVIDQLEKDPDVIAVIVADDHGEIRYSADQNKVGENVDDAGMKAVFQTGNPILTSYVNNAGEALELVAPLKVQGRAKPMGVVRLDMTFKGMNEKIQHMQDSFFLYAIGAFILGMTLTGMALQIWVTRPLFWLKSYLRMVSPLSAETALPEGNDDLGQLNASINELILKFRNEIQSMAMSQTGQSLQDVDLIRQLFMSLEPETRLLLADKDNRIITDSDSSSSFTEFHLLDLMQDSAFGTLVGTAFQQEGQPVKGPITLNDITLQATVLRLPDTFSKGIRTLILLNKTKETQHP
jgi:hypothetical protein